MGIPEGRGAQFSYLPHKHQGLSANRGGGGVVDLETLPVFLHPVAEINKT